VCLLSPIPYIPLYTLYPLSLSGTPTKEQVKSMNPNYQEFKFPEIRAHPWGTIFKPSAPADAVDLVGKMLEYVPEKRMKAVEVSGDKGV
jgi:glycogen synthase kinase 3 beta